MIVRISKGRYAPELHAQVAERLQAAAATLVPAIRALPGCSSYWAGADAASGTMVNVSVWDTLEHAQAMATLPEMAAQAQAFVALGVQFERPIVNYPVMWSLPAPAALSDPPGVHAPLGNYAHTAVVPAGTDLVFVSGQVGMRPDGSVPEGFEAQAEQVFANLAACLAAHGLGLDAVVKLGSFIVSGQDVGAMRAIRQRFFGAHRPASTAVFVPQLVSPAFLIEVEAVAVRPAAAPAR